MIIKIITMNDNSNNYDNNNNRTGGAVFKVGGGGAVTTPFEVEEGRGGGERGRGQIRLVSLCGSLNFIRLLRMNFG